MQNFAKTNFLPPDTHTCKSLKEISWKIEEIIFVLSMLQNVVIRLACMQNFVKN